MKGLWRRLTTAVIFVIIMLTGLFTGPYTFTILFALIAGGCLWEFLTLTLDRVSRRDKIRRGLGLAVGLFPFAVMTIIQLKLVDNSDEFIALVAFLFSPLVFSVFIYELYTHSRRPFANIGSIVLGLFYIGLPFALLNYIAFEGDYFYYRTIFGILLLTWVNDTGAYLTGSNFGRRQLFPRVSPNKTWEGTIGGIVTTLLFGFFLSLAFDEMPFHSWLILAFIVAVFGTIGDLVESMLKRSVGIKDSGTILPGHGGLLDRFDAFIFVVPFASAYLLYIR